MLKDSYCLYSFLHYYSKFFYGAKRKTIVEFNFDNENKLLPRRMKMYLRNRVVKAGGGVDEK